MISQPIMGISCTCLSIRFLASWSIKLKLLFRFLHLSLWLTHALHFSYGSTLLFTQLLVIVSEGSLCQTRKLGLRYCLNDLPLLASCLPMQNHRHQCQKHRVVIFQKVSKKASYMWLQFVDHLVWQEIYSSYRAWHPSLCLPVSYVSRDDLMALHYYWPSPEHTLHSVST